MLDYFWMLLRLFLDLFDSFWDSFGNLFGFVLDSFWIILGLFLELILGRCRFLASRCGLAHFLHKVSFFLRFKPGLLGIRLLAWFCSGRCVKPLFCRFDPPLFHCLSPRPRKSRILQYFSCALFENDCKR